MIVKRLMKSKGLVQIISITTVNISLLKSGNTNAARFSNLDAVFKALDCQPADILEYIAD